MMNSWLNTDICIKSPEPINRAMYKLGRGYILRLTLGFDSKQEVVDSSVIRVGPDFFERIVLHALHLTHL